MDAVPGGRGRRRAVAAAAVAVAAAALGALAAPSPPARPAAAAPATVRLTIAASDGRGAVATADLRCVAARARADGYLQRRAARACRRARALAGFILTPPRGGRACTQVGGPERARLTGRIGGARVARTFTRTHGCGISDYDRLRPLVPPARPAAAPGPALPPY
jgi:hypothetical protein